MNHSENDTLPAFTIPLPSEELCIGRENDLLQTESLLISEPGLLFCNGLAIVDIKKLSSVNTQVAKKNTHQSQHIRRRRQSNGYYRTSVPAGDSRAQNNWNSPGTMQTNMYECIMRFYILHPGLKDLSVDKLCRPGQSSTSPRAGFWQRVFLWTGSITKWWNQSISSSTLRSWNTWSTSQVWMCAYWVFI